MLLEATLKALDKPRIQPEDLVNILAMLRREERMIPMMGATANLEDFDDVRLQPQLGWLHAGTSVETEVEKA